jgi:hypothetical protein
MSCYTCDKLMKKAKDLKPVRKKYAPFSGVKWTTG